MKNQPTYDDANLILRLYDLRREERMREARKWFGAQAPWQTRAEWLATCPPGTDDNASYRMVTTYWEMAATFITTGVLNPELFFRANNLELLFVYEKIKPMLAELRQVQNHPLLLSNLEQVAKMFVEWLNTNEPGYYETFAANIAKMKR